MRRKMLLKDVDYYCKSHLLIIENLGYDLMIRLAQQTLRRNWIFRICRLAQFDYHRLIAH